MKDSDFAREREEPAPQNQRATRNLGPSSETKPNMEGWIEAMGWIARFVNSFSLHRISYTLPPNKSTHSSRLSLWAVCHSFALVLFPARSLRSASHD